MFDNIIDQNIENNYYNYNNELCAIICFNCETKMYL